MLDLTSQQRSTVIDLLAYTDISFVSPAYNKFGELLEDLVYVRESRLLHLERKAVKVAEELGIEWVPSRSPVNGY